MAPDELPAEEVVRVVVVTLPVPARLAESPCPEPGAQLAVPPLTLVRLLTPTVPPSSRFKYTLPEVSIETSIPEPTRASARALENACVLAELLKSTTVGDSV